MQVLHSVLILLMLGPQTTVPLGTTPGDLDVFRTVIEQKVRREAIPRVEEKWTSPWLVVLDRTFRFCDQSLKVWCMPDDTRVRLETWIAQPGMDVSLLRAFVSRNRAALAVTNPDPAASILASSGTFETLGLSDDFWRIFPTRYPGTRGWVRFSAPAYGDAGDAVVYVTYSCGGLCGEGWLIHLTRAGSEWRVANWLSLWVS